MCDFNAGDTVKVLSKDQHGTITAVYTDRNTACVDVGGSTEYFRFNDLEKA